MKIKDISAEELAVMFHDTYEKLAPEFGYKTRKNTREFNKYTTNGGLMIETCKIILDQLRQ
jgi:hypothetical protein